MYSRLWLSVVCANRGLRYDLVGGVRMNNGP